MSITIDLAKVEQEVLTGHNTDTVEQGLEALRTLPCETDEQYTALVGLLKKCKADYKSRESRRKEMTKPLLAAKRQVDGWFKPSLSALTEAESILKRKIKDYQQLVAQRQIKAQEAVAKEHAAGNYAAVVEASQAMAPVPAVGGVYKTKRTVYQVVDFAKLPDEYKTTNMSAIREAFSSGKATQIPGVAVEEIESVGVRT